MILVYARASVSFLLRDVQILTKLLGGTRHSQNTNIECLNKETAALLFNSTEDSFTGHYRKS